MRWSTGMPKARVLPVPVLAWPMMSAPLSATGIVEAWIGKGLEMPWASSAETMCAATPRSAKRAGCGSVESVGVLMIVTSSFARGSRRSRP
jgi:hypothetical protein